MGRRDLVWDDSGDPDSAAWFGWRYYPRAARRLAGRAAPVGYESHAVRESREAEARAAAAGRSRASEYAEHLRRLDAEAEAERRERDFEALLKSREERHG